MFKQTFAMTALLAASCFLTACGDSTPDEPLPEGTTPTDPPRVDTPADPPEAGDESTEPAGQGEPDVTTSTESDLELINPDELIKEILDDGERTKAPGISYILPEGWTVGPEKSMRLLTLLPPDAGDSDLAISKWPGDVGGFASNVQRWVRQTGLPPIPGLMTAAASDFEKFTVGDTTATWIPLMNEDTNYAILAVWVPRGENPENPTETWTFKLTCKADQVEALAPAVRAFCESVKFE